MPNDVAFEMAQLPLNSGLQDGPGGATLTPHDHLVVVLEGVHIMHATMRYYSGAGSKELFDLLEARKADVEAAMRKTPKLVSYTLIRLADAGVSVTVCHDKAGTDESVKLASAWIKENAAGLKVNAPMVQEGTVLVHAK